MNTTTASTAADGVAAKPARRGRKGLAAIGVGLALATTAPVLAGPLTGVARADALADPVRQQLTQDDHGSHLYGHISTIDGAPLRLAGNPTLAAHTHAESRGELPKRIGPGDKARFQYSSDWGSDAEMTFVYAIGDGTWELWAHASVPTVGANRVEGEIRRYGASQADPSSPYNVTVGWSSTSTYNPEPTWTISRKPGEVVTDRAEQANLLKRLCKGGNGSCAYIAKSYVPDLAGETIDATSPYYNDTEDEGEYVYTHGVTTKWTHKITIESSVEADIAAVVKLGVKASYEVDLSSEIHDATEMRVKVKPGHASVFRYTPVMARVSGDFTIFAEGTRYDLKDVDFTFPTGTGSYHAVDITPHK